MHSTFLGINLGVAEVKVVLLDTDGRMLAESAVRLQRSMPQPLWSEQSPEEWWHATLEAVARVRTNVPSAFARLRALGVSGQTQGTVLLDKHHRLLRPAMLWNDSRARAECVELEAMVTNSRDITGNMALPGFTAPKLLWLQKYEPSVFNSIAKVLMPKDFIVFRLCGELVTDMSDASSTLCLDVAQRDWSERMIASIGLTRDHFPRLAEGSDAIGALLPTLAQAWGLSRPVLIAAGAGRPAATAVGLGVLDEGEAYVSLGPSGLVFVSTGGTRPGPELAVRNFGHCLPERWYQLGVIPAGMASLDWWSTISGGNGNRIGIGIGNSHLIDRAGTTDKHAAPVFLPYLGGASTPHNDPRASGVFFGLHEGSDRDALAYAVLEGVAFSVADSLSAIKETGTRIRRASLVGSGSRSRFWTELLVTACDMPLDLHAPDVDGASLGAAHLARLAAGQCPVDDLCRTPPIVETVVPRSDWQEELDVRHARFRRLYRALKSEFAIQEPVP
jgi:xylulokinase